MARARSHCEIVPWNMPLAKGHFNRRCHALGFPRLHVFCLLLLGCTIHTCLVLYSMYIPRSQHGRLLLLVDCLFVDELKWGCRLKGWWIGFRTGCGVELGLKIPHRQWHTDNPKTSGLPYGSVEVHTIMDIMPLPFHDALSSPFSLGCITPVGVYLRS